EAFVETLSAQLAEEPSLPAESVSPAEPERKKGKRRKRQEAQSAAPPAAKAAESPERRVLELKLARVYAEELARIDDAVAVSKRLLEREPADTTVAAALESILRAGNRRDDLRWLLELRIETAPDATERRRLLAEFATLEEAAFEAPDRAVALYRRMLEL